MSAARPSRGCTMPAQEDIAWFRGEIAKSFSMEFSSNWPMNLSWKRRIERSCVRTEPLNGKCELKNSAYSTMLTQSQEIVEVKVVGRKVRNQGVRLG